MTDKKYKVYWTKSAQNDLEKIIEYIADESKINAKKIFQKIKTQAEGLNKIPNKGRVVKEFQVFNLSQYREIIVSPWRIIYSVTNDNVYILCVIDGRRETEEIIFRKIIDFN